MGEMAYSSIIYQIAILALPFALAVSAHEAAHAFMADRLGDSTGRLLGRVTLNPLPHIDLFGTVIFPLLLILTNTGIVFGYAKPVPVNYFNLRDPKKGMMFISLAGPLTNLSLAVISGALLRILVLLRPELGYLSQQGGSLLDQGGVVASVLVPVYLMLRYSVLINVVLAVFNCIPIPPLDGSKVLMGALPNAQAAWLERLEPFGFIIILGLIIVDPFGLWSGLISGTIFRIIQLIMMG